MIPNFLILGEHRAGTTSLYSYFRQHPQLYMPDLKEARYFAYEPDNPDHVSKSRTVFPIRTREEYENLFSGVSGQLAVGEASPNYLESLTAATRIRTLVPDVRLIASIRNPVDRIYSLYVMRARSGHEKRSFADAVRHGKDEWWLKSSFPFENLSRYTSVFPRDHLKIVLFEELTKTPQSVLRDLFRFLEIDDTFAPKIDDVHNKGGLPKSRALDATLRVLKRTRNRSAMMRRIPQPLVRAARHIVSSNLQRAPAIDSETKRALIDRYRNDILRLQELLGRDLSHWLSDP